MALIAKPRALGLDFTTGTGIWDSVAATYTEEADHFEIINIAGFARAEIQANTADYVVDKMAAGAWQFPIELNVRPAAGAAGATFRKAWNAAVSAAVAIPYRLKEDVNAAAADASIWIYGAFLPTKMLSLGAAFGGIVETGTVTFSPAGSEPYIKITYTAGDVYYGKT